MANLNELRKYLTHTFSTGSATGKDYKIFQTKYINYLRSLCKLHRWELVNVGRNHYCFTAFIRNEENKYIYLSISDVRYFNNEWYYHILIRKAFREDLPSTTKIIIAQRISSVEDADMIIVMDGGKIDAVGKHDDLLMSNSIYREVFDSQQKGGENHE